MKDPIGITDLYEEYIVKKNEDNQAERYDGKEHWYHASSVGFCSRKLYFESIEKVKPTNPPNSTSLRLLRLGTIIHDDIQNALIYISELILSDNNKQVNEQKKKTKYSKKRKVEFDVEGMIELDYLNVRGHYDLVAICKDESGHVYLYDFKSIASYGWKLKFGKEPSTNQSKMHELQLATYGLGVKKKYGRLDGMYLTYYCKDTSVVKSVNVPLTWLGMAENYWFSIKEEHKKGLPGFGLGTSPVYEWCCNYCQFKNHCNPPLMKR